MSSIYIKKTRGVIATSRERDRVIIAQRWDGTGDCDDGTLVG
jgi:hypothetical protein